MGEGAYSCSNDEQDEEEARLLGNSGQDGLKSVEEETTVGSNRNREQQK